MRLGTGRRQIPLAFALRFCPLGFGRVATDGLAPAGFDHRGLVFAVALELVGNWACGFVGLNCLVFSRSPPARAARGGPRRFTGRWGDCRSDAFRARRFYWRTCHSDWYLSFDL